MTIAQERRAIARLIDTFGADVLVNITPPPEMKRSERAKARAIATTEVDGCAACGLCDVRKFKDEYGPRWPEAGVATRADLIIVTEFPMDALHRKMIRGALAMSEYVNTDCLAWVPVVSCFPRVDAQAKTLRRPSNIERTACQANLQRAMEAANCPLVLLVGAGAVSAWRKDIRIEQMAGQIGVWRDRWTVAAVESSDVVTRREGATIKGWMRSVVATVHLLHDDMVSGMGTRCMNKSCREPVFGWDNDALPWCERHLAVTATKRPRDFVDERLPWDMGEEGSAS